MWFNLKTLNQLRQLLGANGLHFFIVWMGTYRENVPFELERDVFVRRTSIAFIPYIMLNPAVGCFCLLKIGVHVIINYFTIYFFSNECFSLFSTDVCTFEIHEWYYGMSPFCWSLLLGLETNRQTSLSLDNCVSMRARK